MSDYGSKIRDGALEVVDILATEPLGLSRREIERRLPPDATQFPALAGYIRNKAGEEVLCCRYDQGRKAYIYTLGLSAADGFRYVAERKVKVRNESKNLVGILERTDAKWPGDAQVRMAMAMMSAIVALLDAA